MGIGTRAGVRQFGSQNVERRLDGAQPFVICPRIDADQCTPASVGIAATGNTPGACSYAISRSTRAGGGAVWHSYPL